MTVAVVTGPSRGIGRATVLALAERGVTVVFWGRPSAALDETKKALEKLGAAFDGFECDFRDRSSVAAAAERTLAAHGPPDLVVNNAAVIHRAAVHEMKLEDWDEQIAVNLTGPFLVTAALLPAMLEAKRGRIVHVGSISSVVGTARSAAYNASKWGLVGFMKSLAEELVDTGVTTAALLPGSVDTEMLEGSGFAARMTAEEVAKSIVFLGLDAPAAHNGAVVEMFGT